MIRRLPLYCCRAAALHAPGKDLAPAQPGEKVDLAVQGYGVRRVMDAAAAHSADAGAPDASRGPPHSINILNLHLSGNYDMQHGATPLLADSIGSRAAPAQAACVPVSSAKSSAAQRCELRILWLSLMTSAPNGG